MLTAKGITSDLQSSALDMQYTIVTGQYHVERFRSVAPMRNSGDEKWQHSARRAPSNTTAYILIDPDNKILRRSDADSIGFYRSITLNHGRR